MTAPLPPDPAEVTDGDRAKATDLASMVPAFGFVDAADAIAAAIAAERAAVTRPVLALQEELAQRAADFRWAQTGSYDSGVNDAFNHVADRLRAVVAAALGETGGGQ